MGASCEANEMYAAFLVALLGTSLQHSSISAWSEQDEAKRIAQIKREERRQYEEQMGHKAPIYSAGSEETQQPLPDYTAGAEGQFVPRVASSHWHSEPVAPPPPFSSASPLSSRTNQSATLFWCFHCASPRNSVSEQMQRVVKNLLEVRRAAYPPAEVVTRDCVEPRDLDALPREVCNGYSHCQTLVLTDHNSGTAFTMRGCAERFGAVDPQVLARRADNTCKRLHHKVDIQECVCEHRKYCHAGPERSWSRRYTEMNEWQGPSAVPDAKRKHAAAALLQSGAATLAHCAWMALASVLLTLS